MNNNDDRVMLLIDADNVSLDVIEQAVPWVHKHCGGPHVRRAYCTAESAVKHQAAFKRLGIRPMVNLAAGKNSTDIALAVDAIDLAISERPAVVVIASSDSDFAPLVARLREKGCRVVGIGQQGKTGDETIGVYDDYEVLAHRSGAAAPRAQRAASVSAQRAASASAQRAAQASAQRAAPAATPHAEPASAARAAPAKAPAKGAAAKAAKAPAKKAAAPRKSAARKTSAAAATDASPAALPALSPALSPAPSPALSPTPSPAPMPAKAQAIFDALPALAHGETVELRIAAERLREALLLSRSGSSTKLFGQFPELFELVPAKQPNHVKRRAPA